MNLMPHDPAPVLLEREMHTLFLERPVSIHQTEAFLDRAKKLGDPALIVSALVLASTVQLIYWDDDRYEKLVAEGDEMLAAHPDLVLPDWARWRLIHHAAFAADRANDEQAAMRIANEALAFATESDMPGQAAESLALLGWITAQRNRVERCFDYSTRAIRLAEEKSFALGHAYWNLATVFDANGAYDEAVAMMHRVLAVGHVNVATEAIDRLEMCRLAVKADQLAVATESVSIARRLIEQLGVAPDLQRRLTVEQARLHRLSGDAERARDELIATIAAWHNPEFMKRLQNARLELMLAHRSLGAPTEVLAVGATLEIDYLPPTERIEAATLLAESHKAIGQPREAIEMLRIAIANQKAISFESRFLATTTRLIEHNDSISAANRELAHRNDQLAKLQHEKHEVLSLVAHDLRGGLAALMLAAEREGGTDRRLEQIVDQFSRIISQFGEMVDIERSDARRIGLGVEVTPLIERLVADETEQLRDRKGAPTIVVRMACGPTFCGSVSEPEVVTIVDNLLSNAIRYSPPSGTIEVVVDVDINDLLVTVTDEGPGVGPADADRIFKRFHRLDRAGIDNEPTAGLGLALVKQLVGRAGGSVGVTLAGEGTGAHFWVRLPAS